MNQEFDEKFERASARAKAHEALAKAQSEFPKIQRSKEVEVRTKSGGTYTFSYAPLEVVNDSVLPALNRNGFAVLQPIDGQSIVTMLIHSSGHIISSETTIGYPEGATPQERGSHITYMRRYALVSMLGLATEDDDDGNHASGNTAKSALGGAEGEAAQAAAVEQAVAPAPAAASSPVTQAIQTAQAAQQERAPARPDTPQQIGANKKGEPKYECVTHVANVEESRNGWWNISVVIDGQPRDLTTKLRNLIDAAIGLRGTSALVRWTETQTVKGDKTYVNRYLDHIEMAEGVAAAFPGAIDEDIPF